MTFAFGDKGSWILSEDNQLIMEETVVGESIVSKLFRVNELYGRQRKQLRAVSIVRE